MADATTKIVVDLSASAPNTVDARRLFDDALALQQTDPAAAISLFQAASDAFAAATRPKVGEVVELTAAEVAQRQTDQQAAQQALTRRRQQALMELRMKRDRYLAQTDVFALPDAALPRDMPQAAKDALTANRDQWLAWRQALRDYPATVVDPLDPPAFPTQPAQPVVLLT